MIPKPFNGIALGSNLEAKFVHTKKNEVSIVIENIAGVYDTPIPQYHD